MATEPTSQRDSAPPPAASPPPVVSNLARVQLTVGGHRLAVRVARTDAERALGLMYRRELAADEGMLFMCDAPAPQSFWMKDTPLSLSIAFLADDGTIVEVADMEPGSLESCCCEQPVRFVLEVNRGWFAERGIGRGDRLAGPPFLIT